MPSFPRRDNDWHEGLGKAYDDLGNFTKISILNDLRKREKIASFSQSTSMPLLDTSPIFTIL